MIGFSARIITNDTNRALAIDALQRMLGPTRVLPGCVRCELLQDCENQHRLALIEWWEDEESLVRHIKSRDFRVVLAFIDMSTDQPEVRFDWTKRSEGFAFVEETLN